MIPESMEHRLRDVAFPVVMPPPDRWGCLDVTHLRRAHFKLHYLAYNRLLPPPGARLVSGFACHDASAVAAHAHGIPSCSLRLESDIQVQLTDDWEKLLVARWTVAFAFVLEDVTTEPGSLPAVTFSTPGSEALIVAKGSLEEQRFLALRADPTIRPETACRWMAACGKLMAARTKRKLPMFG